MSHQRILPLIIRLMLAASVFTGCARAPATTLAPAAPAATRPPMATSASAASGTTPTEASGVSTEKFVISSQALKGNRLGDPSERPVQVILPPGYSASNKRYPVVYYLHFFDLDQSGTTPALDVLQRTYKKFLSDMDRGMRLGETQEMILVFPNSSNLMGGSFYRNSPVIGDYETYITKELVAYVDSHYRTVPQRDSRGLAGCSMGGDGTVHLALKNPDVYGVAVAQSGPYFIDRNPCLADGVAYYFREIKDYAEIKRMSQATQCGIALAAAAAPNDKPPLYFDMPYVMVDGKAQLAPGIVEKLQGSGVKVDVQRYLAQPTRLNAFLVQHGKHDLLVPVAMGREFDALLTQAGIAHEFDDSFDSHCSYDMMPPMLKFMSSHLRSEGATK